MAIDILLSSLPLEIPPPELRADSGAVVDFLGVVRALEGDAQISGLEYAAHVAMAEHQLRKIASEAASRFGLHEIQLHHRIGFVPAAEASLFLRVQAGHRGEAFKGSRWIIEELKRVVPIWKEPVWVAGG